MKSEARAILILGALIGVVLLGISVYYLHEAAQLEHWQYDDLTSPGQI